MKRTIVSCSLVVALLGVLPSAAMATPSSTDKKNASQQCRELRAGMGTAAFNQLYGTNKNDKNAFGKCVSQKAKEERNERKEARQNASKTCKAERDADRDAFNAKYGTNKGGKNAFGKCVSQTAKANKQAEDDADAKKDKKTVNAAKTCRAEQKQDPAAFREKYGTNERKRNAFGKCVSQTARAKNDDA